MRPSSRSKSSVSPDIAPLDALFEQAGLVHNPRRPQPRSPRAPRPATQSRFDRVAPEELAPPLPVPRRAANGVEWLPIPGWDLPWLWSGFSTRKGGLSRAYCAENAPGELNLGFTAADDRETVLANRRLLAEAVTGDAATPLLALKQFHSNLVVEAGALRRRPAWPAPRRRPNHRRARSAARRANRRLHPGSGCRSQAAHRRRLPRRLARNRQAHRRNRRWPHASRLRLPSAGSHRRHRSRRLRLLLLRRRRGAHRIRVAVFLRDATSSARSSPPTPSKPNTPCSF